MDTPDTNHRTATATRFRPGTGLQAPGEPYQVSRDYTPPEALGLLSRTLPATPPSSRHVSRRFPATPLDSLQPTKLRRKQRRRQHWIRRQRTWPQRVGGLLIAGICVVCAAWYVPGVMRNDRRLLTGTVTSTGVITLNFADSGEINKINVRFGETVRKGRVLATEYAPNTASVIAAETAAIASDQARIKQLRAAEAADPAAASIDGAQLSADNAQLALDEAQLASDGAKVASTEIIAPSFGTVVAANGQPGEIVTSSGIRDYVADSPQPPAAQRPEFSLFPEGPQSLRRASASQSALPVIALRTSTTWQVVALIPEDSVAGITSGRDVTISVPAAHITGVRGKIDAVLPTPIATSEGTVYQAVVTITGHARNLPLNGMTADVQLGS